MLCFSHTSVNTLLPSCSGLCNAILWCPIHCVIQICIQNTYIYQLMFLSGICDAAYAFLLSGMPTRYIHLQFNTRCIYQHMDCFFQVYLCHDLCLPCFLQVPVMMRSLVMYALLLVLEAALVLVSTQKKRHAVMRKCLMSMVRQQLSMI